jgi:hypothetical protein
MEGQKPTQAVKYYSVKVNKAELIKIMNDKKKSKEVLK